MKQVRIILAGQYRGDYESWYSLKRFKKKHNAKVYVGSHVDWVLPFEFEYVEVRPFLKDTIFRHSTHPDGEKYIYQWSPLYQTYKHFCHLFDEQDVIVKLRNDLVFPIFDIEAEKNTIHVPHKEWHADKPFPTDSLCNDQMLYGFKSVMNKYFNLPYDYSWNYPKPRRMKSIMVGWSASRLRMVGMEEILRLYLYQQDIVLKTFELFYDKALTNMMSLTSDYADSAGAISTLKNHNTVYVDTVSLDKWRE